MLHDAFHHPFAQSATPERFEHEYIPDVSVGRTVRDDARKSYLLSICVQAEAQRVLDGTGDNLARDAFGPIAICQEPVDNIQVKLLAIGANREFAFAVFVGLGLNGSRRHTLSSDVHLILNIRARIVLET